MPLKPGSAYSSTGNEDAAFRDSMAEAIEDAFQSEWLGAKEEVFGDPGLEDRKILFSAIAQGLVNHLRDNLDAFIIDVTTTQTTEVLIESENPSDIPISGSGAEIRSHDAIVEQVNSSNNLIKSEGSAILSRIEVE